MKKPSLFSLYYLALLMTPLLLSGCGDDEDDNKPATKSDTMSYTADGVAQTASANTVSAVWTAGNKKMVINGQVNGKSAVGLQITGLTGPGTYLFYKDSLNTSGVFRKLDLGSLMPSYNTAFATSNFGSVVVTQFDEAGQKMSGTFSFTAGPVNATGATGEVSVTSGTFSVSTFH